MTAWLALGSVWIALASVGLSVAMLVYRPAMTDIAIVAVLYFGAPGSICLGGLVLWAYRHETAPEPGVMAQRVQAKVGVALAIIAATIVYGLIIFSEKLEPFEARQERVYNFAGQAATPLFARRVDPAESRRNVMQITLNGELATVREGTTIADLLAERDFAPVRVAVEVNEEIVPRRQFSQTTVHEGDRIEVVTLVGGG
jgi:sulfur carrier protein